MTQKEYNLYIFRLHHQVRAKQKLMGCDRYFNQTKKNLELFNNRECSDSTKPKELSNVERYEIVLDILNPNLHDLYSKIQEACPEFISKKSFHLYWKYSSSKILPITNYITYVSMLSLIASQNRDLYLVDREWNEIWLRNIVSTYTPLPEDTVLVNMFGPQLSAYTAAQEDQLRVAKSAATIEFTETYSPPHPRLSSSKSKAKTESEKTVKNEQVKSPQSIKGSKIKSKK